MKRKFKQLLKQRKELEELIENSENTLWAVNEEIKATCEHEETVEKSTYYSGGYDYRDETNTWEECTHCGKKFNRKTTYGSFG